MFLWVEGPDLAGVEEAIEGDGTVDRVGLLTDLGDERLYRMEWTCRLDPLVHLLFEEQGGVLSARATGNGWCLQLLAPTPDGLSRVYDNWKANDVEVDIHSLYDADQGTRFDLTAARSGRFSPPSTTVTTTSPGGSTWKRSRASSTFLTRRSPSASGALTDPSSNTH